MNQKNIIILSVFTLFFLLFNSPAKVDENIISLERMKELSSVSKFDHKIDRILQEQRIKVIGSSRTYRGQDVIPQITQINKIGDKFSATLVFRADNSDLYYINSKFWISKDLAEASLVTNESRFCHIKADDQCLSWQKIYQDRGKRSTLIKKGEVILIKKILIHAHMDQLYSI